MVLNNSTNTEVLGQCLKKGFKYQTVQERTSVNQINNLSLLFPRVSAPPHTLFSPSLVLAPHDKMNFPSASGHPYPLECGTILTDLHPFLSGVFHSTTMTSHLCHDWEHLTDIFTSHALGSMEARARSLGLILSAC